MDLIKVKKKYERQLKNREQNILDFESSGNIELEMASLTLKKNAEELRIIVDALEKQIPMQAYFEYDDEFICPTCSYEDDGYDVRRLKVCPDCGQKLKWD